ncbi:MAG: hypothetical protein Q8L08_03200 [Candidatus Nanopelagicaceae bacterium]|nr:hypothetical protein [Candidatus Nanopelagicaceae bacterium]
MKIRFVAKPQRGILLRVAVVSMLGMAALVPANAAETVTTPLTLFAPKDLTGVPALPFTGVKSATFTSSNTNMSTLDVTPIQGPEGTPITISGKGLPANTALALTWSTADGAWVADVQPNTVNYMGVKYVKYNVDLVTVTTDAAGAFTYTTKIPRDFGGVHDIYAIKDGAAIAHGGFQMNPTLSISPKSGPIGTPITVTYTGMGPNLYTGGISLLWDNSYAGAAQAIWTRGTSVFKIRAAGPVGKHYVAATAGIGVQYMNIKQSPVPYAKGSFVAFTVTKDAGAPAASIEFPPVVQPVVSQRTTLSDVGLDPNTKAVATLSSASGEVGSKVKLNVTGLTTTGTHQIVWSTVVGNRVNCTGTCWVYNGVPMGSVTPSNGSIDQEVTIPDNLGGWHVIQVKQGDVIEAQIPFYVKESIFNYVDKNGKILSRGIAKADTSNAPESRDGSGVPTRKFKAGEEFTIAIKGVGWTQLDNTLAVTYDNNYIGYGCGFNSNGYMVVHLIATGAPGTHIIDLRPVLYVFQPSFANAPYGALPILTNNNDIPGLALGYQPPAIHFAITIVK